MAAIKLNLLVAGPHVVDDLGITISGDIGDRYDLVGESPEDVSLSEDLQSLVADDKAVVLDPRDAAETILLSKTDSAIVLSNHNQIHYGVIGGRLSNLDDPSETITDGFVPVFDTTTNKFVSTDVAQIVADSSEAIEDIVGDLVASSDDLVYDDAAGTLEIAEVFLRNTGDDLESGTLNITSGAKLTIQDAPTAAKDGVNKEYVDGLANGLDHKESVKVATTPAGGDLGFTYDGSAGTLTAGAAAATTLDGTVVSNGDRVLVKNQTDPVQNGIYVVSGAGASSITVLTRAEDQNGDVDGEVSAGNRTFVEVGTVNGATGWVVTGAAGDRVVDTDDIIWTQDSGQGNYAADGGVQLNGRVFSLDVDGLASGDVDTADSLVFADASDAGESKKVSVDSFLDDLGVVNGITETGFAVRNADGSFSSVDITASSTDELLGRNVVAGDGSADVKVGLDIKGLEALSDVNAADRVAVWDSSANKNVYYTIADIANSGVATSSFSTWSIDGVDIVADSSTDTVTINSGDGIKLEATVASDTLTIEMDIGGLTASSSDLADTDVVPVFNGTDTVGMSGAQISAKVVSDVEEAFGGMEVSTINGQPVVTVVDATRGNKRLSTDSNQLLWSENKVGNNEWFRIASAADASTGYVAPLNGTIVFATGHCENTKGNTKKIMAYVGGDAGIEVGEITGSGEQKFNTTNVNIDFAAGEKIRLRAEDTGNSGPIEDTVISLHIRWRAA